MGAAANGFAAGRREARAARVNFGSLDAHSDGRSGCSDLVVQRREVRMNKLVAILMLSLAVNGFAQVEKKSQEVEKSFEPKYLQGDTGNRAIQFVSRIMAGRARIEWDPVLRQ